MREACKGADDMGPIHLRQVANDRGIGIRRSSRKHLLIDTQQHGLSYCLWFLADLEFGVIDQASISESDDIGMFSLWAGKKQQRSGSLQSSMKPIAQQRLVHAGRVANTECKWSPRRRERGHDW